MKNRTILIGEGDDILRHDLKRKLQHNGFAIIEASYDAEILRSFQIQLPDLVIIGSFRNGSWSSLEVVRKIRQNDKKIPIILITRQSTEALAISALRAGINDYFKIPVSTEELVTSVSHNLHDAKTDIPNRYIKPMVGDSLPMQEIKAYLQKVAAADSTVLITGETGTGKELAAELVHMESRRQKRPFMCINCAALPDSLLESELFGHERGAFTGAVSLKRGKFELAKGGTIFLDEIGDMSLYAQAKILRTIERKEIYRLGGRGKLLLDVRVIAATNQNPERLVEEGKFRKDLYYRLNIARIHLPPLRERKDDIPFLLEHFKKKLNRKFRRDIEGFTQEALEFMLQYDWPGNIRELKNILEATFINSPSRIIAFQDMPRSFQNRRNEVGVLPQNERDKVLSALFANNWNKSKTAEKLHWSRMTLYRKMAKYRIVARPLA